MECHIGEFQTVTSSIEIVLHTFDGGLAEIVMSFDYCLLAVFTSISDPAMRIYNMLLKGTLFCGFLFSLITLI